MASQEGSGTMYRMLAWFLFHGLSRQLILRLLKRLADSRLASNRNNKFSHKNPRIRQEKSLMIASILNSIDASIAKGNLKKQVVG